MKKVEWKLKISIPEFVCYVIGGLVMAWGLAYIIVGLVAKYAAYSSSLYQTSLSFKATFGLSFLGWGLIILGIGALFNVIILCALAKRVDREFEKEQRRAARLAQMKEAHNNENVVDAEVK